MNFDKTYTEMIKGLTDDDYIKVGEYDSIERACIVVGLNLATSGAISNPVIIHKFDFSDNTYFKKNKSGIIPFFFTKESDSGKFELFEMTYETYCRLGF